ncbi:MAG TPA: hypothetical protein VFT60_05385, partial [Bryobacteraceae bacterium]|nr:hypothetical protein [Bryobacteraceae bacterium]
MKFAFLLALGCSAAAAQSVPPGLNAQGFPTAADLDSTINQAIRENKIPGAVLLIGHNGAIVYRKAYGER